MFILSTAGMQTFRLLLGSRLLKASSRNIFLIFVTKFEGREFLMNWWSIIRHQWQLKNGQNKKADGVGIKLVLRKSKASKTARLQYLICAKLLSHHRYRIPPQFSNNLTPVSTHPILLKKWKKKSQISLKFHNFSI